MKHPERIFVPNFGTEGEEMRRSNWKESLMAVAILIGIICALAVTIAIEGYSQYRGLTFLERCSFLWQESSLL